MRTDGELIEKQFCNAAVHCSSQTDSKSNLNHLMLLISIFQHLQVGWHVGTVQCSSRKIFYQNFLHLCSLPPWKVFSLPSRNSSPTYYTSLSLCLAFKIFNVHVLGISSDSLKKIHGTYIVRVSFGCRYNMYMYYYYFSQTTHLV